MEKFLNLAIGFIGKNRAVIIIFILSFWAVKPLFVDGYFPVHDATQVERVYEMSRALKEGQFPVRWVADLGYGYGYPIFNFYSPFPYYAGALLNIFGLDLIVATKGMFLIGILLSGFFMFLLAKEFWGETGGIVSALFYIYAPYHALDVYVRGAVGEYWAIAFLPLVFYGFYLVRKKGNLKSIFLGAIGLSGVILSHNITAIILAPILFFLIGWWIIEAYGRRKISTVYRLLLTGLLGLGLSAFFWLPAILEVGYTNVNSQIGGGADFRDHFIFLDQLWDGLWGYGGSAGRLSGISFKIGKAHILLSLAALAIGFFEWLRKKRIKMEIFSPSLLLILAVFFSTELSKPIWEFLSPMAYIQYPWRFLIFMIFTTSFLVGTTIYFLTNKKLKIITAIFFVFILIFFNAKYFTPKEFLSASNENFISEENLKWKVSKVSDEYLPPNFPKPNSPQDVVKQKLELFNPQGSIKPIYLKSDKYMAIIDSKKGSQVLIKTPYFPGWQPFLDGRKVAYFVERYTYKINVPPGEHELLFIFKNTIPRNLGNFISLFSIAFIILQLVVKSKRLTWKRN